MNNIPRLDWVVNQSDGHLAQMACEMLRVLGDMGAIPLDQLTVEQRLKKQNCQTVLDLVVTEQAHRKLGRWRKELEMLGGAR
jgi:hypothetical protein